MADKMNAVDKTKFLLRGKKILNKLLKDPKEEKKLLKTLEDAGFGDIATLLSDLKKYVA